MRSMHLLYAYGTRASHFTCAGCPLVIKCKKMWLAEEKGVHHQLNEKLTTGLLCVTNAVRWLSANCHLQGSRGPHAQSMRRAITRVPPIWDGPGQDNRAGSRALRHVGRRHLPLRLILQHLIVEFDVSGIWRQDDFQSIVMMVVSSKTRKPPTLESSSHLRLMTQAKMLPLMTLTMTWQRRGGMTSFNYMLKLTIRTTIMISTRAFSCASKKPYEKSLTPHHM
jgi:hypothetical protein